MKIFSNEQNDKIEIAVGQPVLEKSKKSQQPESTDHFIYIQTHIYGYSHVCEEYEV